MAGRIKASTLLADMTCHKLPWRDQDGDPVPETMNIAFKVINYCEQEKIPTAIADATTMEDPRFFISIYNLGTKPFAFWVDSEDAKTFWSKYTPVKDASGEDLKPESRWDMPGTRAFQRVAVEEMARHFFISEKDEGLHQLYRITDHQYEECAPVIGSPDDINTNILRALYPAIEADYATLSAEKAHLARKAFLASAPIYPAPMLHAQPHDSGWCLHRAKVMPDATVPFPCIQSILDRCNDPGAVAAYLWGVYSNLNKGRQNLWLEDLRGEGSKSTALNAWAEGLFGTRIYAVFPGGSADKMTDTHTSSAFLGKRLILVPDCNNPYLLNTALFKSLAGNDPVYVNPKYLQPYMHTFDCRTIIASNYAPFITSAAHSRSRVLYIQMTPLTISDLERDVHFGDKCKAELPGFLAYAREEYERRCPNHYAIAVNDAVREATEARIAMSESRYAELFYEHFIPDEQGTLTSAEWNKFVRDILKGDHFKASDTLQWMKAMFDTVEKIGHRKDAWVLHKVRLREPKDDYASEGANMAGAR